MNGDMNVCVNFFFSDAGADSKSTFTFRMYVNKRIILWMHSHSKTKKNWYIISLKLDDGRDFFSTFSFIIKFKKWKFFYIILQFKVSASSYWNFIEIGEHLGCKNGSTKQTITKKHRILFQIFIFVKRHNCTKPKALLFAFWLFLSLM